MCVPTHYKSGLFWFSTTPGIVFLRKRMHWNTPDPIQLADGEPLRITLAIAAPRSLKPVKYDEIKKFLQKLAKTYPNKFQLLKIVTLATKPKLDEALKEKPHIFHFISHGELKDEKPQKQGRIALIDKISPNQADWIDADLFGQLFLRHRPRVVIIQSCESGASLASKAFASVASQVGIQKIPVVIAMQYEISNAIAQNFSVEFYKNIADNMAVDQAVQESRYSIGLETSHTTCDFAIPTLFMCVSDGHIFPKNTSSENHIARNKSANVLYIESALSKLVNLQILLHNIYNNFNKEKVIWQSRCEEAINVVENLEELVRDLYSVPDKQETFSNMFTYNYKDKMILDNLDKQIESLYSCLSKFYEICPPSPSYKAGRQYDKDRDTIEKKLKSTTGNCQEIQALFTTFLSNSRSQ